MFTRRTLDVDSNGVTFCETVAFGGVRRFRFSQVDLVLMSPEQVLSFQVGREVFSIPTRPGNKIHQQVIETLVRELRET